MSGVGATGGPSAPAAPATRQLAIVLATGPARGDLRRAADLARAARAVGVEVAMFAMHDGVDALAAAPGTVAALLDDDCEIIACASSATARGLGEADLGVLLGSQDDHAALVHRAGRVVSFT
ncbi:MAG: DsrE family protein [Kofleriaceae bacterium]|nr:DsrE family protein [Kofleriaceae bacterium]